MKRYKKIFRIMALVLMLALFVTGCGKDFDASGYTQALLDLTFQGDTSRARTYMEDATENSLMRQYQQSIDNFVAANITNEIEMNETKTAQFADLVSKIFATMRYDVGKAEKTGKRKYEVPVSIQPSDVFVNFQQSLSQDSIKITQKIKEGGYEGTTEEVTQQVLNDIVNHAYELLDAAYQDTAYGEEETVILHVQADKNHEYSVDEDDMNSLVLKILRLDEIQG